MGYISYHIMPLVINRLRGGHMHAHNNTDTTHTVEDTRIHTQTHRYNTHNTQTHTDTHTDTHMYI